MNDNEDDGYREWSETCERREKELYESQQRLVRLTREITEEHLKLNRLIDSEIEFRQMFEEVK